MYEYWQLFKEISIEFVDMDTKWNLLMWLREVIMVFENSKNEEIVLVFQFLIFANVCQILQAIR